MSIVTGPLLGGIIGALAFLGFWWIALRPAGSKDSEEELHKRLVSLLSEKDISVVRITESMEAGNWWGHTWDVTLRHHDPTTPVVRGVSRPEGP